MQLGAAVRVLRLREARERIGRRDPSRGDPIPRAMHSRDEALGAVPGARVEEGHMLWPSAEDALDKGTHRVAILVDRPHGRVAPYARIRIQSVRGESQAGVVVVEKVLVREARVGVLVKDGLHEHRRRGHVGQDVLRLHTPPKLAL